MPAQLASPASATATYPICLADCSFVGIDAQCVCRAVQSQQWQEAVAKYTDAIYACTAASPAFAAVLHSNRAAAYQGLNQYADAIADSLRSRALHPMYVKVRHAAT